MWPLSVYEVPISSVEKMERGVSSYNRKWLGAPNCLSSVELYGKGIVQMPVSSLIEEFKCTKVRTEMLSWLSCRKLSAIQDLMSEIQLKRTSSGPVSSGDTAM